MEKNPSLLEMEEIDGKFEVRASPSLGASLIPLSESALATVDNRRKEINVS